MVDNRKLTDKEKVLKGGWIVAIGIIAIFFATTTIIMMNGIDTLNVPIAILMVLVFVYPLLFFFVGVWVVMKKKLFPLKK